MRARLMAVFTTVVLTAAAAFSANASDLLKPYVLSSITTKDLDTVLSKTRGQLRQGGFTIAGEYAFTDKAHIIVVTNEDLQRKAVQTPRGGFAAAQRVSVVKVNGEVQVAYTNPVYMAHAYRLDDDLSAIADQFASALGRQKTFGAEGMTVSELREYHYAFGMEYFDDPYELGSYDSHRQALEAVERGLANSQYGLSKVYRIDIPGVQQSIFGVARDTERHGVKDADDDFIMNIVDHKELKKTAYLPYEIMVDGKDVIALHMRFRMAVNFPDMGMLIGDHSFRKLMSSPDAIKKVFLDVVGKEDVWGN